MFKQVFEIIGYDYYKGLKNKLPPIRYMGKDEFNNELVILAHPKDFYKEIDLCKKIYDKINQIIKLESESELVDININKKYPIIKLDDVKHEILEIYPSISSLGSKPNGFIGLFVNEFGMNELISDFGINDEVQSLKFLLVTEKGIDIKSIKTCGVIDTFIKKFNNKLHLINKYNGLYLVVGEMKDIDIKSGITKPTNKFNIIGGKRTYDENNIISTVREAKEELGLNLESKIYKFINIMIPKTKDIIRCYSFDIFCIFYSPNSEYGYNHFIQSEQII